MCRGVSGTVRRSCFGREGFVDRGQRHRVVKQFPGDGASKLQDQDQDGNVKRKKRRTPMVRRRALWDVNCSALSARSASVRQQTVEVERDEVRTHDHIAETISESFRPLFWRMRRLSPRVHQHRSSRPLQFECVRHQDHARQEQHSLAECTFSQLHVAFSSNRAVRTMNIFL